MGAQFSGCLVRRQEQGCTQERGTAATRCALSVQPQPWCLGCPTAGDGCSSSLTQSFPQGTSPFQQEAASVWLPFVAVTICVCEASSGSQPWLRLPRLQTASCSASGKPEGNRSKTRNETKQEIKTNILSISAFRSSTGRDLHSTLLPQTFILSLR